ncbi:MAG: hypothetical protein HYY22_09095 [Thaumarchaeota archaeon]|nr:hypothetical protein [Nitrososphaerota archaeon]
MMNPNQIFAIILAASLAVSTSALAVEGGIHSVSEAASLVLPVFAVLVAGLALLTLRSRRAVR